MHREKQINSLCTWKEISLLVSHFLPRSHKQFLRKIWHSTELKKYLTQFSKCAFLFGFYIDSQSFRRNYNLSEGHRSLMLVIMIDTATPGNHMLLFICISVRARVSLFIPKHSPYTKAISLNMWKTNWDFIDYMGQQGARVAAEQSIFYIEWRLYYTTYKCRKTCLPEPSLVATQKNQWRDLILSYVTLHILVVSSCFPDMSSISDHYFLNTKRTTCLYQ